MNMATVWQSAKPFLLWAMVAVAMATYWTFALVVLVLWEFSFFNSAGRFEWEAELIDSTAAWLIFLNVANFFVMLAVAIAARKFAGGLWPAGISFALLGVSNLTIAVAAGAVALSGLIWGTVLPELSLMHWTNIFLAFTAGTAAIITPLLGESRRLVYALGLLYGAVIAHTAVVVLFLGAIVERMGEIYGYGEQSIVLVWLGLSGGLVVLGVLSWRQGRAVFTLAGAATARLLLSGRGFMRLLFMGAACLMLAGTRFGCARFRCCCSWGFCGVGGCAVLAGWDDVAGVGWRRSGGLAFGKVR